MTYLSGLELLMFQFLLSTKSEYTHKTYIKRRFGPHTLKHQFCLLDSRYQKNKKIKLGARMTLPGVQTAAETVENCGFFWGVRDSGFNVMGIGMAQSANFFSRLLTKKFFCIFKMKSDLLNTTIAKNRKSETKIFFLGLSN